MNKDNSNDRANDAEDIFMARASLILTLRQHSIVNPGILKAFEVIPHEVFIPKEYAQYAYKDKTLPIGFGQSMTSPVHLAKLFVALEPDGAKTLLEIGTGSGYGAAVLSRLARRIFSVEKINTLSHRAQENWANARIGRTIGFCHDGLLGLEAQAPFERILLSGSVKEIPKVFFEQLADGGILVAPVGMPNDRQIITKVERVGDEFITTECGFIRISALKNK